jgi:rubrerythrin
MVYLNKELIHLLQQAYSAEKAAAFAYQGHAASLKKEIEKQAVKQIELDEWKHRADVLKLMNHYQVPVSKWFEFKYHVIGKIISGSCYVLGWFMPYYFAGNLESGNVCEYFKMKQYFNTLGIREHDEVLYEMGIKEKEHEVYFLEQIKNKKSLSIFEKIFGWGKQHSLNNVDLSNQLPIEKSDIYCKHSSKD